MRPLKGTYPEYLEAYIAQAKGNNLHEALLYNTEELLKILYAIPDNQGDYAYSEGKWTIKQLLIHISDSERIFSYRLLRFIRGDEQQPLPFEEDEYAANCNAGKRSIDDVIEELVAVRNATTALIESLQPEDLNKKGKTSAGTITVNALGFAICGHCNHHLKVLIEKYLNPA